jgi:hypothetical protein
MAQAGVKWLQRAGYQLPPADDLIEGYEPHIRYTTVFVKIDPAKIAALYPAHLCADAPIMGLFVPAAFLGERRILAIKRIEGHRRKIHLAPLRKPMLTSMWTVSILTCQPGFDAKINCVQDLREYVESIQQIKPAEPWIFTLLDYISTLPEENIAFVRGAISEFFNPHSVVDAAQRLLRQRPSAESSITSTARSCLPTMLPSAMLACGSIPYTGSSDSTFHV